jgi:hypothetical protein
LIIFLFAETVRIKYKVDKSLFQKLYADLLRRKLSDFLVDERRREERAEERRLGREERRLVIVSLLLRLSWL